jgi:prepilin-type N-terminal cleavage/methylation domain-containing protein
MVIRAMGTRRLRDQGGLTLIEVLVSMVILVIISTMIIIGWANLQRASANALRTNQARASLRDAMSRVSVEIRAAQPLALPAATASAAPVHLLQVAAPMDVRFYSAFNADGANSDGTGTDAVLLTRIWLDPDDHPAHWNPDCGTLLWQRDTNDNGALGDTGDQVIVLARNVANDILEDTVNNTDYTAVFRYGYRATPADEVEWTDNNDGTLDLTTVVAVSARLIIDKKMGGMPNYVDLSTTVRLRNILGED